MSLVLAIQPDRDQAARLASVCRRIGTEVVLASSAPEALAILGDRVPDVILSAPLLPATDDAAIAERLRLLGDNALHVQALSAPMLGDPVVEPQPKGLLKAFTRPRRPAAPAVCDAIAFAGELSGHLLRAVAERAAITGEPIEAPAFDDVWVPPSRLSQLRRPGNPETTESSGVGSRTEGEPVDIELAPLLDAIADNRGPRKRKGQSRRRRRRVYDDAAYFDPERCKFAEVIDRFDEFTRVA